MLKYLIQIVIIYALLQYVFKVDLNSMVAPYLEPVTELIDDNNLDLDGLDLDEVSEKLLDGNFSDVLENADLEQLQNMINTDQLSDLLEDKNLTKEDAQQKIEEMKEKLQHKLEQLKEQ